MVAPQEVDRSDFKVIINDEDEIISLEMLVDNPEFDEKSSDNIHLFESKAEVIASLGNDYYIISSDKYREVMIYIDKKRHEKLVFCLGDRNKALAIILYNYKKSDYEF